MNNLPEKPAYAVLFISEREVDPAPEGYPEMDDATMKEVSTIEGFIGFDVARTGKDGIFISYWRNVKAIEEWKHNKLHKAAKAEGHARWYDAYRTVICKIEHFDDFRRK
ncbi:antibiotic biosynthesis monooxygenase family protein [Phaeocystidibacter luteus]|uniref:Antibiotic biosynthesis monooxygenase n=1 Tax=Phaeocystidibacter luteus TaxID=911197 RepID=A0A6N6RHG6_9FLAO|nr:antibiotic biosynthesis monooxygenase [Phaeocystidibacter luteus]KAB2810182.1 antibiotic biosynthesis monooxygenase [Phaeocystidibacter luteus]